MSTQPTPTEDANEGNGSSIINQLSRGDQAPVGAHHVALEEEAVSGLVAPMDDSRTMPNNAPESTNTNDTSTNTNEDSAASLAAIEESDSNISMQGGRLWQAAALEAERRGRTMDSAEAIVPSSASQEMEGGIGNPRRSGPTGGPGSRFAETFMERTRSRADPNALFADPKGKDTTGGTLLLYMLHCYSYLASCRVLSHLLR